MITRPCDFCQEDYQAEPRYLNRGQGRFCSRKCAGARNGKLRTVEHEPNVECAVCHERFYVTESKRVKSKSGLFFCSKAHQDEGYRLGLVTTGPAPSSPKTNCVQCGKSTRGHHDLPEYCRGCGANEIVSRWLNGDNDIALTKGATKDTKRFVKKYLIETRGDACEQCGFNEKAPDGRSIIQMDHIDGNCLNNDPSNLRLLCPNHHAMTPNYGSLNKGSGRSHRRKP